MFASKCAFFLVSQRLKGIGPRQENGKPSWLWLPVAGGIAGLIAQTAMYPGDTVRKLMIINGAHGLPRRYTNTWVRFHRGSFTF
jgi:hypothetical protein